MRPITIKAFLLLCTFVLLLTGCKSSNDKNETIYLPVKLSDSEKWSIINIRDGSIVVRDEYENEPTLIVNDRFFVMNKKGEMELYDIKNLDEPIDTYAKVTHFRDDRALVLKKNSDIIQIIDTNGDVIKDLPSSVEEAESYYGGACDIIIDNKHKYINADGETVSRRTDIPNVTASNSIKQKGDKWIIVNENGVQLSKDTYDNIEMLSNDRFIVRYNNNGKYFLVDEKGNDIGDESFSNYKKIYRTIIFKKIDGKWNNQTRLG